jgi:hypothetical protein
MKRLFFSIIIALIGILAIAQTPESFNYQVIVRDGSLNPLTNQDVSFRMSILKGSISGTAEYTELHSATTNGIGLVNLIIGNGTGKTGDLTTIDWGADKYFLKVEIDPAGEVSYTEMGTTQLLSVPYALHAKTSSDSFSGDYNELINVPATKHIDTTYIVELTRADEDYINFGTFENFTNGSDWSVIEKVMMPAGTGSFGGWHFFRGKGWVDQEGDIAIQITKSGIYAWCMQGGWNSVVHNAVYEEGRWYTICLQYDATAHTLGLYADSALVAQITDVLPQDDSGNTNKLFWGGQDVDPSKGQGDLYSETSIVIACQDWFRRKLTLTEIQEYVGNPDSEAALFFSSRINSNSVIDGSGNGHNGINGNSPVFLTEYYNDGSEFNETVHVNDDLYVAGNLVVGGTITGSIKIDTIHVSQITGLLGQNYTMIFPQVLDNTARLEIDGVIQSNVVIFSGPGHETDRISEYMNEHDGVIRYREHAGFTMEYPLIFETTNETDMLAVKGWFDDPSAVGHDASLIIKNLAGTETGRWNLQNYIPDNYETGNDGRTRFSIRFDGLPDNYNACEYQNYFGAEHSYNPATDTVVVIDGVDCGGSGIGFTPAVELNTEERTITLTMDYNEGYKIYDWVKSTISGAPDTQKQVSIIQTVDGTYSTEIRRYNHFECIPIKYEHIYGFGLNTKLKARIVIAYGIREKG